MKKVGLISLGCPKNLVDSEVMLGFLKEDGYGIASNFEDADLLLVNTCGFIQSAKEESIDAILEAASHKRKGKPKKLVVSGCLVARYKEELKKELPEVDFFIGTDEFQNIGKIISGEKTEGDNGFILNEKTPRVLSTPRATAYVKIAEGCKNFCSYCIIPKLRGPFRTRRMESVVSEVKNLAQSGIKEVNLIAQDITSFGDGASENLEELIERLNDIEGIHWIRLLYAYPTLITNSLIKTVSRLEKVVNYLDIPVQHGSDRILKLMNRKGTIREISEKISMMREIIPDITLRTSVIVGFPGETEEDFEKLYDFVKETEFDRLGAFAYSKEEGTKAFMMEGHIPERIKKQRLSKIMNIQKKISLKKNKALIGKEFDCIIEGFPEETELLLKGRISTQAPDIDGITYIQNGEFNPGDIVRLKITGAHAYDLAGEAV